MKSSTQAFERILAPITFEEFLSAYWQRRHLVVRREDGKRIPEIFTSADVDRYLAVAAEHPSAQLATGKAPEPPRTQKVRDVDRRQLYELFANGATIQLAAIDRAWPAANELAAAFARAFSARVKINVYMTPAGHQGAPIHPDVQDVFILQMEGEKEWYLYDHVTFEMVESLEHGPYLDAGRPTFPAEPPLAERLTLHEGDFLYVPRGLLHRAVAPPGSSSLHLTICVTPFYGVDLLKAAVEQVAMSSPELSRPLMPGFERDESAARAVVEGFAELLEHFHSRAAAEPALQVLARLHRARTGLPADGHFEQLIRLEEVSLSTVVERRAGLTASWQNGNEQAVLRFGKQKIQGPPVLGSAFALVVERERFEVSELPATLGDDAKLTLVRRLIKEGLLRAVREEA